ncbi:MAG: SDR family NAD(P)-dependent oxidoreductase [Caldicoprobacterales bacterium]|jgi:3-oxoacyl-[acyl-carrier protein] reductase|nr:3-oxoacyl-ACP reductase FabG [Clostridiales bacterium]
MDFNLKGKTAIVTGGGSGLGAAICEVLTQEGANVIINYIVDEANVFKYSDYLSEKYGTRCIPLYGDITNARDIDNIIERADDFYGRIDILVNNAGVWPTRYVKDMSDEEWNRVIEINLTGTFMFSKRLVNYLLNRKARGKIINIVSQAAFHGSTSGHAHYAAAKGGVVTFTVSLAREVAPHGINVTAVAPGMMRTPMNKDALAEREEEYLKRIPLGRIADPREVAYTVAFLASDKADYITGATIDVTGGMLMR